MAKTRRKKSTAGEKGRGGRGTKPGWYLLLVVLLIVLAFFLLEKARTRQVNVPVGKPIESGRFIMPPRPYTELINKPYTSVKHPVKPAIHPSQPPKGSLPAHGRVAIIIDDMGSSLVEARQLLAIDAPLTFSIIPGLSRADKVAEAVREKGREVMLHIPMEPNNYPKRRLEANGLLLSMSDAMLEKQIDAYMDNVPFAVGANNHMGSHFTENERKMRAVLSVLRSKGLYFIDSMTSPRSVGYRIAKEMGIKSGTRSVFLDNVQEDDAIRKQLEQLAIYASKHGSAIGICHPHPTTIRVLAVELPRLKQRGIEFVPASQLVR